MMFPGPGPLFMPIAMPMVWNVGPMVPGDGGPEPRPLFPIVQARIGLEGDEAVRYHTGSREPRVLIVRLTDEGPEELVAVLTPEQVAAIAIYWQRHGVDVKGVVYAPEAMQPDDLGVMSTAKELSARCRELRDRLLRQASHEA